MKLQNVLKLSWAILLLMLISACENEEDPIIEDVEVELSDLSDGELKIVMEDSIVTANEISAVLTGDGFIMDVDLPGDMVLTITADSLSEDEFDLGPGPYEMSLRRGPDTYTSNGGSLEFTDIDSDNQKVSGTFITYLHQSGDEIVISSAAFKGIPYTFESGPEPENGHFTATVNGNSWAAETITAQVNSQVNVLDIRGTTEENVDISIYFNADIEPGTYQLSANGDYVAVVYEPDQTVATHYSQSGQLTITEHDVENDIIKGQFQFEATSQSSEVVYDVDSGEFSYEGYY